LTLQLQAGGYLVKIILSASTLSKIVTYDLKCSTFTNTR